MMKKALGDDFKMVFDIKQAVRAGYSPTEFAKEFKNDIIHIHVSDNSPTNDCLPPSKGNFDYRNLFSIMENADYKGDYIIELYRWNFSDPSELAESLDYLQNIK